MRDELLRYPQIFGKGVSKFDLSRSQQYVVYVQAS